MISLRRVGAVVLRQYYLTRWSFSRILSLFSWIVIDMVLWGFITKYLNRVANSGFDFVPLFLGAIFFWDFFGRVMHGLAMAFLEDVWARNFFNFFTTPLTILEYLVGLVVSSILTSLLGLMAMLVLVTLFFGLSFFSFGIWLFPYLLILFLFGIALGVCASAVVLRFGPSAEWMVWPVPSLLSPLAGVFYPLANLPWGLRVFSYGLPPSYVFESMRALLAGESADVFQLMIGVILAVGYVVLAIGFYTRTYRQALETGLIARYSAESVQ